MSTFWHILFYVICRTIADLKGTHDVLIHHIMEAIAYRNLDRPNYYTIPT